MSLDDDSFLAALAACEFPASEFGHRQHLRLARLHLQRAPLEVAIERTCADIARFAAHHGAHAKFHRTVTEALLRLMAALGPDDVALLDDARGLLARHYSPTLLATPEARLRFIPPDLLPLPA
ncbi:hypothetical protein ACS5PN_06625 [Roseateles sp. NT4]|uniref:hypothetical protein n=1 Tax=Roseateles sp. NT4 TaxID=3453715 RepID=UPI003EEAE7C5